MGMGMGGYALIFVEGSGAESGSEKGGRHVRCQETKEGGRECVGGRHACPEDRRVWGTSELRR